MGQKGAKKDGPWGSALHAGRDGVPPPAASTDENACESIRAQGTDALENARCAAAPCGAPHSAFRKAFEYSAAGTRVLRGKYNFVARSMLFRSPRPAALSPCPDDRMRSRRIPSSREAGKAASHACPAAPCVRTRHGKGEKTILQPQKNALNRRKPHATAFSGSAHCIP